jgi:hypothetical protein
MALAEAAGSHTRATADATKSLTIGANFEDLAVS